jgi:DNA-binding CsgD family transcriptional regulator
MTATDLLIQGREAFARNAWPEACVLLSEADVAGTLTPRDIDMLAMSTHMTRGETSVDLWTRAHYEYVRLGETAPALRCAFWICLSLNFRGEFAQSSGWFSRATRLCEESSLDCVELGYLSLLSGIRSLWSGDPGAAMPHFVAANETARRFGEPDLVTISGMAIGETCIAMGETDRGTALLDEAMAAVIGGQVSPPMVGIIYCAVLSCCQRMMDVRRSQEWTAAFSAWCETQTDLLPYRGECVVYRAEVMQHKGAWVSALDEMQRATAGLDEPVNIPWAGRAFYQQGELNRLSGRFEAAEESYRRANQWGCVPQPGLALLRLAQGRTDAARSALTRALAETHDPSARSHVLAAQVDALLASGDVDGASSAAGALSQVVAGKGFAPLDAISLRARGSVELAQGRSGDAIVSLRAAFNTWRDIDMPYELARTRVLLALACRALGDEDGALLELETARAAFEQLGAAPDVVRVDGLTGATSPTRPTTGLTPRELEVLRLVAAGNTNRAIAEALVLSEKTVARHVSNIFARLGISSRSAATAYAYEHNLLDPST